MLGTTSRGLLIAIVSWCVLGCAAGSREPPSVARPEVAAASAAISPLARVAPAPITAANVERVKLRWQALPGGFARGVTVHRGLGRVAFSSDSETHLYQLQNGAPAGTFTPSGDVVRSGLFFYDSALLVVCRDGVERYDVAKARQLARLKVHESHITAATLSGSRLALAHRDGVIRIHDLAASDLKVVEVVVPGPPIDVKSLALDADGQRIAVAWVQGSIWWWQLAEPAVYHRLVRHESESDSLAFAANGLLAEEGRPGYTTLWRLGGKEAERRQIGELRNGDWIKRLWFTRDSEWLVRGGSDGLELAEVGGPKRLVLESSGQVEDIGMDETGSVIVSGDRVGRLLVFGAAH
jgi:hypothetical protein